MTRRALKSEQENKIAVVIAAHKAYRMPDDPMYIPLHVGACRNDEGVTWDKDYEKDDTGDNISRLNPSFCELTGLYWLWKNRKADYMGLVHYRRHFCMNKGADPFSSILRSEEILPYLGKIKIFVPGKRKYYIETLYSHYAHTHFAVQLDAARETIEEKYPDHLAAYDKVVKQTWGYMFNMVIMTSELMDEYCRWIFDILFALKEELGAKAIGDEEVDDDENDKPVLSDFEARFYGRISEILFNVWLKYKVDNNEIKPDEIMELKLVNTEGENWGKKISSFLGAKFFGKKYDRSF